MVGPSANTAGLSTTCPLCHTVHESVPSASLQADTSWTCRRCGQTWTPARLNTVAAYTRYKAARSVH
jgi:transposase-like protein